MSKKLMITLLFFVTAGLATGLYFKNYKATPNVTSHGHASAEINPDCPGKFMSKQILIRDGQFYPNQLDVEKCTVIEFVNYDKTDRLPAFGIHDEHLHYPGYEEEIITSGQYNSFVATKQGTFNFHDHYDESMQGTLTVK